MCIRDRYQRGEAEKLLSLESAGAGSNRQENLMGLCAAPACAYGDLYAGDVIVWR